MYLPNGGGLREANNPLAVWHSRSSKRLSVLKHEDENKALSCSLMKGVGWEGAYG